MNENTASQTDVPVYSPRINLDMMTVKRGAELFTVSAKDTATFFKLIKPRTTVVNLEGNGGVKISVWRQMLLWLSSQDLCRAPHESDEQHDHNEVGGILGPRLVLVEATRHEHLEAADDGGGEHLNGT